MTRLILFALALFHSVLGQTEPIRIAVAANFKQTLDQLIAAYDEKSTTFTVSAGATGLLYSQIVQGAPFDLFFSADVERPLRLEQERRIVAGSRFTYAAGQLVLWAPQARELASLRDALRTPKIVAIADPKIAPYGAAAEQVLSTLGWRTGPPFKLVRGESIGQTFQFVASGHANAGFIALSQVEEAQDARVLRKQIVRIDPSLYDRLDQDVVLLSSSRNQPAAKRFLRFVRGSVGRRVIESAGYTVP